MATRDNLTIFEVRNMRRFWEDGLPICRIEAAFGVSQRTVSNVVRGRTHKRVRPVGECSTKHPYDTMTLGEIQALYASRGLRGHEPERRLSDQGQEALAAMSAGVRP